MHSGHDDAAPLELARSKLCQATKLLVSPGEPVENALKVFNEALELAPCLKPYMVSKRGAHPPVALHPLAFVKTLPRILYFTTYISHTYSYTSSSLLLCVLTISSYHSTTVALLCTIWDDSVKQVINSSHHVQLIVMMSSHGSGEQW